jgi:putative membrane protein
MKFIAQILTNSIAIFLADYLVPNFTFKGNILMFLIAGLILGLINFFLKPILKLISAPVIFLSLGLFLIVINMGLLWVLDYLLVELTIVGITAYFWGVLIISITNMAFGVKK